MNIRVDVPIKVHLKYFLENEFGPECKLKANSPLARVLFGYLDVREKKELPKIAQNQIYFPVIIPVRYFTFHKVSAISEEGFWELGDWFDRFFTRLMVEFVKGRLSLKEKKEIKLLLARNDKNTLIQLNESLLDFLKQYEVTDEYMTLDTAKKRFTRAIKGPRHLI